MENIGGIFVVLICGLIIAVFVAVMEFIWSTRRSAESEEVRRLMKGMRGKSGTSGVVGGREDCGIGSHSWKNAGEGVGAREGRDDPPGVPELQKEVRAGTSLVVQWLGLGGLKAEGPGSIPGRGTKIPQAAGQRNFKKRGEGRRKTRERVHGHEDR